VANVLDQIFAFKREDLTRRQSMVSEAELRARVADAPPARGFHRALRDAPVTTALIAEVKRASPTAGTLREDFDPVAIATAYRAAGAQCLSVLTDTPYFRGSPADLVAAREASGLPVLRKDFTVDAYDVWEARAMGADAILLIVNGLTDAQLVEYRELAESLGMDALVETHCEEEAARAVASLATLIGVNNRDLATFETSVNVGLRVLPTLTRSGATLVSESALSRPEDIRAVTAAGARAVLIGTAFSRSPDIAAKVREVMSWSA